MNLSLSGDAFKITYGFTDANGVFHKIEPTPIKPPILERCIFCEGEFDLNALHPGHVKYFGEHPHVCRNCGLCFEPYGKVWSEDLEKRIIRAKDTAGMPRDCFMCKKQFNLLGSFYKHMWYKDTKHPNFDMPETNPEWGGWINTYGIDFLYPNLYTEICPRCFQSLFWQNISVSLDDQSSAVRELGEKIGKLPTRNFPTYIYSYQDRENVEWFLTLLKRLPDPELINLRFGSYFKLLIQSGLLPDGTRRMRLGTWVIANDGDMCFSLVERDIDNWLSRKNIPHKKEVRYPESDMRCDWEVSRGNKRIFIEYFGLMNRETYAEKAALKYRMAKSHGIQLIGILPDDDWESKLSTLLLN